MNYLHSAQNEIIGTCIAAILIAMSKKIYSLAKNRKESIMLIESNNKEIVFLKATNEKLKSVIETQNIFIDEQKKHINHLKVQLSAEQENNKNTIANTTPIIRSHTNIMTVGQSEVIKFLNSIYGIPADKKDWLSWPANSRLNKIMLEKIVKDNVIIRLSFKNEMIQQTLVFLNQINFKFWEDKGGSGKKYKRYHVCFPLDINSMHVDMIKTLLKNCI